LIACVADDGRSDARGFAGALVRSAGHCRREPPGGYCDLPAPRIPPVLTLLSLLALTAAPAAPTPAPTETSAALVDRCVAAHGGVAALERARAVRVRGAVTSKLHPGQIGQLVRTYERPDRLRVEVAFPDAPREIRVLEGARGWRNGQEVTGPQFVSMLLQVLRVDLPWLLHRARGQIVDLGVVEVGNRTLRALAVDPAPGIRIEADIDPATALIVRSRSTAARNPALEFITTYDDHRVVGGVRFAFHEGNWANGQPTGDTLVETLEVAPPAPAAPAQTAAPEPGAAEGTPRPAR
jgi:hypothetical protein